jgi:uncharacterized protein YjbJ (UPF0337 family)
MLETCERLNPLHIRGPVANHQASIPFIGVVFFYGGVLSCVCHRQHNRSGISMNKDQVKGAVKEAAGKVQQKTGQILDSLEQEAKGLARKLQGKAQKNLGDAKEKVGDAKEALKDAKSKR